MHSLTLTWLICCQVRRLTSNKVSLHYPKSFLTLVQFSIDRTRLTRRSIDKTNIEWSRLANLPLKVPALSLNFPLGGAYIFLSVLIIFLASDVSASKVTGVMADLFCLWTLRQPLQHPPINNSTALTALTNQQKDSPYSTHQSTIRLFYSTQQSTITAFYKMWTHNVTFKFSTCIVTKRHVK